MRSELTPNVWYLHKWWACVKGKKDKEGKGERKHIALRIGVFNTSLISTFLTYNPGWFSEYTVSKTESY